jgi:hypothetical protein
VFVFVFLWKTSRFPVSCFHSLFSSGMNGTASECEIRYNPSYGESATSDTPMATKELLQARLTSAKESAMAKARKSRRPPKSRTKPTAADSEMKENLDPQATSTTDKKRTVLVA